MRVVYLTLGIFILLGIGANCRTPALQPTGCTSDDRLDRHCISERAADRA